VIDLHCHLLPGVDDGSRTVEQSLGVLEAFAAQGISDLCLTPHLLASMADEGVPAHYDRAFAALAPRAPAGIRLYRGAEVMLDRPLPASVLAERTITLNGGKYILVEFPRLVASRTVGDALKLVVDLGLVPLVAHPERYVCCSIHTVRSWKALGALMQVDATTLFLPRSRGERARALVAEGLADILAADNHGDDRTVATAREALREQRGAVQAELLTVQNPRAILDDRPVVPVPVLQLKVSLLSRLKTLFDSQ
jgi:protein-tyrosine phosphatase